GMVCQGERGEGTRNGPRSWPSGASCVARRGAYGTDLACGRRHAPRSRRRDGRGSRPRRCHLHRRPRRRGNVTSTSETAANDAIAATVVEVLRDMTSDWDLELSGGIGLGSQLVNDLGCESLDIVMLIVALEGRFGRSQLPWGDLL